MVRDPRSIPASFARRSISSSSRRRRITACGSSPSRPRTSTSRCPSLFCLPLSVKAGRTRLRTLRPALRDFSVAATGLIAPKVISNPARRSALPGSSFSATAAPKLAAPNVPSSTPANVRGASCARMTICSAGVRAPPGRTAYRGRVLAIRLRPPMVGRPLPKVLPASRSGLLLGTTGPEGSTPSCSRPCSAREPEREPISKPMVPPTNDPTGPKGAPATAPVAAPAAAGTPTMVPRTVPSPTAAIPDGIRAVERRLMITSSEIPALCAPS